ncbi:MAG TPA: hypothetical protein VGR02_13580 [Thermoanaerobaculia bacterium]|nr:hypothetical protein [Thermoanaerobaculia bacterium]
MATAHALALQFRIVEAEPEIEEGLPGVERDEVRQLRDSLRETVKARVLNGTELIKALAQRQRNQALPTTLPPFDTLLGGGLPRGKMIEVAGRRSTGRFSIAMAALAAATSMGEAAVFVDLGDGFDPQIAESNGIDLRRLLWIRPKKLKDAVMAVEMIAAAGFQLVVLDTGSHQVKGRVPDAAWVRLARTAEAQGTALLVSTPYPLTGTASEAVVAARKARGKWAGDAVKVLTGMAVELTLEKHRHLRPGRQTILTFTTP